MEEGFAGIFVYVDRTARLIMKRGSRNHGTQVDPKKGTDL